MIQLSEKQREKLAAWVELQDEKVMKKQRGTRVEHSYAYYGAAGGAYSYIYTPTGLGLSIVVRNNLTKEEIDLTEYDW